ncbi:hypothetical protein GAY28_28600, partial [Azospirillum brasilense]|nr:hypothetical protein [Azospirillum brasilense]
MQGIAGGRVDAAPGQEQLTVVGHAGDSLAAALPRGGGGHHRADGGDGVDTAVFEGAPTSYTIRHGGAGEVTVDGP